MVSGGFILLLAAAVGVPVPTVVSLEVRVKPVVDGIALGGGTVTLRQAGIVGDLRTKPISIGQAATFDLPTDSTWEISVDAPGTWSRPDVAQIVAGAPQSLSIDLYPAGALVGAVRVPAGTSPPTSLKARFRSAPEAERAVPEQVQDCPVTAGKFVCPLPAGRWDVRLRAARWRTQYFWGAAIPVHGRLDVGSLDLKPGATVVGWIESPGPSRLEEAAVELRPLRGGQDPGIDAASRQATLQHATHASPRGFFELSGVAPGLYAVTVRHPRYAPTQLAPVEVLPLTETELHTIRLQPPVALEARVDPPVDPSGRHWTLVLEQEDLGGGHYTEVQRGLASADGVWRAVGLETATYLLTAEGGYGSRWAQLPVDVHAGMAPVDVRLPFLQVEGLVRLGGEPLQALLWFGGFHGSQRIAARSDREGKFSVVLPEKPSWRVEVVNQLVGVAAMFPEVETRKSPVQGRAKVVLDVPDTAVRGITVDETGSPLRARVHAGSGSVKPDYGDTTTMSDAAGKFELRGLAVGAWSFEAIAGDRSSDNVEVEVRERTSGLEPDLQLVLRQRVKLSGMVVDPAGNPVYAAHVAAMFPGLGTLTAALPEASTDVSGVFRLELPAAADEVVLSVFPPGFAARQVLTGTHGGEALVIPVSQEAGRLVVEFADAASARGGDRLQLTSIFHESLFPPVNSLENWATLNGSPQADPLRLAIPMLEPGPYTACFGTGFSPLLFEMNGSAQGKRCVSGELATGGELVLKLPPAPPPSPTSP